MKALRIATFVLISLLAVAGLGAGVLYIMASVVPADYRPPVLSREKRKLAASRFYELVQNFVNEAENINPFEITLSQQEINEYLASIEEIFQKLPGPNDGNAHKLMDRARLAGPMVLLKDGRLTLMARATEYGKVVSLDLSLGFADSEQLRVGVTDAHVGILSPPGFLVRRALENVKGRLGKPQRDAGGTGSAHGMLPSAGEVGKLLHALIAAVDEEPIMPIFAHRKTRGVQLTRIEISTGKVVLGFRPYGRKAPGGTKDRPGG